MQQSRTLVSALEKHFEPFRRQVVGYDQTFRSPYGEKRIVYADWTASGRLYGPIEEKLSREMGPFVGNTHTETSITGTLMTKAYHEAQQIIKRHVNAGKDDVIICEGSGMTGVIAKFQRILGLRIPEKWLGRIDIKPEERPVVFISHMEHHSNHTSWIETIADVECILPDKEGLVDIGHMEELLQKYKDRPVKIASLTACSNVTGIRTDYHHVAKLMHQNNGLCFVDFACSAPYVPINMHPADPLEKLDAIYFSPHKFLGGPGATGALIFDRKLYNNRVPDKPGGGTVAWTNPWGEHRYFDDIEAREDGGTPAFLQTIKAAMAIRLKEEMGVETMLKREEEMVHRLFHELKQVPGLHILADHLEDRLGVISFYIDGLHYNLGVKLLNDRFGVQMRGGCSCAGTYGHYLLQISRAKSKEITNEIDAGDLTHKPGWIRLSIHPIMTDAEVELLIESVKTLALHHQEWAKDYRYDVNRNEFFHKDGEPDLDRKVQDWFEVMS